MKTPASFSSLILIAATLLLLNTCDNEGAQNPEEPYPPMGAVKDKLHMLQEEPKMDGPAQFAAYHALIRTRDGEASPAYPPGYRLKEFQKNIANRRGPKRKALPWTERGPGNVGGRTRGIWVDPTDPTHLSWFAGAAGGGIWKTEDGGASWRELTTGLGNLAASTIAGSAANPDVLYAGTGEGFSFLEIAGTGVWKSTNGGEYWKPLESTLGNPKFAHVMRIAVNPENENEIAAATRAYWRSNLEEGDPISYVFKSTDGGLTWEEKLRTVWEEAPVTRQIFNSFVVEHLIAHPYHFDTLYAAINDVGIKRSFDGGDSWETVFNALSDMERIELAISPTNPNILYFAAEADPPEVYRSADHGESWRKVRTITAQSALGYWMGSQGWYNNTIAVHPFNPDIVFVGGAGPILKIAMTDTTQNPLGWVRAEMEPVTDGYLEYTGHFDSSTKGVHVDHHNLTMIPINEATGQFYIIDANDGGIAFSNDGGETFTQTGDTFSEDGLYPTFTGYNTAQFYGVDKMNGASRYVGGTQDNGCWVSPDGADAESRWDFANIVGDGFEVAWHYQDPDKILVSIHLGRIYRSDDGGNTWRLANTPLPFFFTRIANSKAEPDLVFSLNFLGLDRSQDFGNSWEVIRMPEEWTFSSTSNVRISLASPLAIWSGSGLTAGNRLAVSRNGGLSFEATGFYEEAVMGPISGLATHPFDPATAYALFSMADGPKVLRTADFGNSWEDISGFNGNVAESNNGFPDVATYSLLVMPFDTNRIWAGTEIGLFESLNGGLSWTYAANGLPAVAIWDMKIVNDEVVLATHGRGAWSVALPQLAGYEPPEPVALAPEMELERSGINGEIAGNYSLPSVYDSARIIIEGHDGDAFAEIHRIALDQGSEPAEGSFNYTTDELPEDTLIRARVSLIGYKNSLELTDRRDALIFEAKEALAAYSTGFDDGLSDFARLGFDIYEEAGFGSQALHSPHPYSADQVYMAVLQHPIVVSGTNPALSFDEIALVEPGEPDSEFGTSDFYDYVLVDGTRDRGLAWEPLEGYDARRSDSWLDFYMPFSPAVDPGLMENHTISLSTAFEPGDTVFLRFTLASDPGVESWGWVVDNLEVQGGAERLSKQGEERPELEFTAYPNPANGRIWLRYMLPERQVVRIDVYTINGRRLSTPEQGAKPAGEHQAEFDASRLAPGVYLFRLEVNGAGRVVKWVRR